ncbi:NADH-quinone oxidoreductase subunit N [Opitutus sp. GAS368]|uniref:NADH-quinone oxidoreductase subunit N n=1 Tax=Opitutus sp. GAS368 TaxID=1882749 RepID=UPI00087CD3A6|nr:NADH-quinone oxidoreductase subunit N [Opitutus sp. GAS368]SDS14448.1 NADH-quinone oxidoreductase subunit N [Opitutus sp. GAS368]
MSTELLKAVAASNDWWALGPELTLAVGALCLLVLEIFSPKKDLRFVPMLTMFTLGLTLITVAANFDKTWGGEELFGGLIRLSASGQIARVFFLVSSLLVCFLATICLPRARVPRVEFYHIVLVVTAALMLLAQSNHFVMFFVALETVTIGFYILVSYYRERSLSLEAGLKYLVLGALSSAILLFGIVLLYGAVGRVVVDGVVHTGFEFGTVFSFLRNNPGNFLATAGALLILGGVAFKIGAFPFQIWVPDVYQGAPTPVTAFLAVSSKAAGFAVLLLLVSRVFAPLQSVLGPVLSLLAATTILFGNLSALTQRNTKRLMGLSGVSHAGYLLIGVTAALTVPWAAGAVWFYLFTYLLASMAVFGVMAYVAGPDDRAEELDHYERLAKDRPFLGAVLAIGVGSLAGIPPLAGFMGKLLLFLAAFQAHLYGLLGVAVVGVVISIFYYFGWIRAAFFESWTPSAPGAAPVTRPGPAAVSWAGIATLAFLALATVLLGFFQQPLTSWLLP